VVLVKCLPFVESYGFEGWVDNEGNNGPKAHEIAISKK